MGWIAEYWREKSGRKKNCGGEKRQDRGAPITMVSGLSLATRRGKIANRERRIGASRPRSKGGGPAFASGHENFVRDE